METFFVTLRIFVILSLITIVTTQSIVEYSITEEETPTVVLGNIVEDSELRNLNSTLLIGASYEIVALDNDQHEYFSMDNEDLLYVQQLDRDEICPMAMECIINLDVQVQTDTNFYLVKVSITVLDINDRVPTFREDVFQFFLSEASAIGMTLSLPTATDLDSPENGLVGYIADNLPSVFEFQSTNLEPSIVLKESLDRETADQYVFILMAIDSASFPNTGSTEITIQVSDINDNSPEFDQTSYQVEVSESMRQGEEIVRVTATDIDVGTNAKILYQLSDRTVGTYGDLFTVNEDTGQVILNGELDYEAITEASLTIIARNPDESSLFSSTRIDITVKDVNDNAPQIRVVNAVNGNLSLAENSPVGTFLAQVKVKDDDTEEGGRFDCSLDSSDFDLDHIGGEDYTLKSLTELDRETIPSYELAIKCNDHGTPSLSSESIIQVHVIDENDNRPHFENNVMTFNISESVQPGDEIFQITATDADIGDNARISYTLGDVSLSFANGIYFEIEPTTGAVSTKHALDYENITQYGFLVIARDNGNDPLSSACNVTVHILDEDDNAPLFGQRLYSIDIAEGNEIGAEVTKVTANDADSFPFNTITYELVNNEQAAASSNFSINATTGAIFADFELDRETDMSFSLTVMALGPPPMSNNSTAIVHLNVLDVNDNDPVIAFPSDDNNTIAVPSYLRKDSIIAHIIADDSDEHENARLSYHIVSGNSERIFALDESAGYLSMNVDYKVTQVHTIELGILVSDNGVPPKSSPRADLYIEFNETMAATDESGLDNKGKNESIAIIIGVLSGVLVVILLVAIICVFRRINNQKQVSKAMRLQSHNDSNLDTSSAVPYGEFPADGQYGEQTMRGFDNPALDQSDGNTSKTQGHYTADGYNPSVGPGVKDSGSEGSNADSGHGSHEDTSSNPGAGSLQKWDHVFLPPAGSTNDTDNYVDENEILAADQRQYPQFTNPPPYSRPQSAAAMENMSYTFNDPEHTQPMTSQSQIWLPLEDCHPNTAAEMPYGMDHSHPYDGEYRESPDLYRHLADASNRNSPRQGGPVIDLRDYERDNNEYAVDNNDYTVDEVDQFNCDYRLGSQLPRHMKRRSNSFANDYFPTREYDVYPGHIAGFCTPQPKNIKYCSQV